MVMVREPVAVVKVRANVAVLPSPAILSVIVVPLTAVPLKVAFALVSPVNV